MAYILTEDEFGRQIRVPVFNESEDGSGTWHVPVCDSSGYLKVALSGGSIGSGKVYINDDANAKMTIGLTINQGANDDEILALKSSDVAHSSTAQAEADTYFSISKIESLGGGAQIWALSDANATLATGLALATK